MSTEVNKNVKYTKEEKTALAKKVDNVTDVQNLVQKTNFIVSKIKEKHT